MPQRLSPLRRSLAAGGGFLVALSGASASFVPAAATSNVTYENLAGSNRYQTAGNLNAAEFPSGVDSVVLADGVPGHESDALAASGLAGIAPRQGILLTDASTSVPADTMAALAEVDTGKKIVVVGGSDSVSAAQQSQLTSAGYTITRTLAGPDRFGTMQDIDAAIAEGQVGTSGTPAVRTAILASGDDAHLSDALAAAGLAYADHFAVLLTESSSASLIPQDQKVISDLGIKRLIVVGGSQAVPTSQYSPMPSGITQVDTAATTGADRSATSELLEKDEVASYGATGADLAIAAGATLAGGSGNVQNDGADALAGAPFTGGATVAFMPTCVSDSPSNAGSLPACGSDLAATLTTLYGLSGPTNQPASQAGSVCSAAGAPAGCSPPSNAGGGGTPPNQPPSQPPPSPPPPSQPPPSQPPVPASPSVSSPTNGSPVTVTFTAIDANGNPVPNSPFTINPDPGNLPAGVWLTAVDGATLTQPESSDGAGSATSEPTPIPLYATTGDDLGYSGVTVPGAVSWTASGGGSSTASGPVTAATAVTLTTSASGQVTATFLDENVSFWGNHAAGPVGAPATSTAAFVNSTMYIATQPGGFVYTTNNYGPAATLATINWHS